MKNAAPKDKEKKKSKQANGRKKKRDSRQMRPARPPEKKNKNSFNPNRASSAPTFSSRPSSWRPGASRCRP
jgi:hypothetical protein